ncbi:PilW family protein [Curvibacter sp. HBC61]|uniref:PilW family protein n=1 Tax=Curvibacter cyanobacteriorum TaxID=3026422 RepID=A0ABT5MTM5_9BURK|nr:PilW family protein [Curvibacter sp. HBC61]MDD0837387.1 PilW family protein [Curvibacter sp. HBC61]
MHHRPISAARSATAAPGPGRHQGLTLIELMVALAISTVVALAAVAALSIARQGFTANDASAQLRDSARFVTDLLQRLGVQTGFRDLSFVTVPRETNTNGIATSPIPNVYGLNNQSRTTSNTWDAGTARVAGTLGDGSDILVLRFQPASTSVVAGTSDNSMIDCTGAPITTLPQNRDDRAISILHVAADADGEPALMCSTSTSGAPPFTQTPLVRGVEVFQVLYGVDRIGPNNTTVTATSTTADSVPDRYLRADQITVSGNQTATNFNWSQVRALRIGMVVRGAPNQAADKSSQTFYPLGLGRGSSSGALGSAMSSSNDRNTVYTPAVDGRMRKAFTFTIHLRNAQDL